MSMQKEQEPTKAQLASKLWEFALHWEAKKVHILHPSEGS